MIDGCRYDGLLKVRDPRGNISYGSLAHSTNGLVGDRICARETSSHACQARRLPVAPDLPPMAQHTRSVRLPARVRRRRSEASVRRCWRSGQRQRRLINVTWSGRHVFLMKAASRSLLQVSRFRIQCSKETPSEAGRAWEDQCLCLISFGLGGCTRTDTEPWRFCPFQLEGGSAGGFLVIADGQL